MSLKNARFYRSISRLIRWLFKSGPTRNFEEFFAHVKKLGFYPGSVVDLAAANGTPALQCAFKDAYFVWVEPLKEFIPDLETLESKRFG